MAKERLPMRKIREILRLRWGQRRSVREVTRSLEVSTGVVARAEQRARAAELSLEQVDALGDVELERRMYGRSGTPQRERPTPDPGYIHHERKKPGVTLELLHQEYLEQHPDGYGYTAFCEVYRRWLKRRGLSMRGVHRAGEKCFTDFSGKKPTIIDARTGQATEVELFVAVLGASSFTYVEAVPSQRVPDWIEANERALHYFGGVPEVTVPDQLKSAVTEPSAYEPGIQRSFADFARHYDMAVVPARPRKPKDKAKVEVAVQVAQRWILARIRHETFYSLKALNARIRELLSELNARPMARMGGVSRQDLFERLDQPALRPLPTTRFECGEWLYGQVEPHYHVRIQGHLYSVPHVLRHEKIEARVTRHTVELFHRGQRVASHLRDDTPGGFTTEPAHMPEHHRWWATQDPERMAEWAATFGPNTEGMVRAIFASNFHHEQNWRSVWGLRQLAAYYTASRLERACEAALSRGACSYKHVERILKLGRDRDATEHGDDAESRTPADHANLRGPEDFVN